MGIQKKEPESIKSLLSDVRNKGMKNPQCIRKLLARLTEKNDWSDEECRRFYEALLRKYVKNEQYLNLMLAVSGVDERFGGCLISASKRRENYFEYLRANDPTEERVDVESLRRNEEEQCLNYIAEKLEEVIKNGKSSRLVEQLILGEEEMKNTEENTRSMEGAEGGSGSQEQQSASHEQKSNVFKNIINFGNFYTNNGGGNQDNSETKKTKKTKKSKKTKNKISLKTILIGISVICCGIGGGLYYTFIHLTLPPVENILLPPEEVILKPNTYYEIKPYISPEESANAPLSYTSEDPEVATVSRKGVVLAQGKWEGEGSRTAKITIQAENGITAKQSITVEKNSNDVLPTADVEDFEVSYVIQTSVRLAGTTGKNWTDNLNVKIGDELEYQIYYENTGNADQCDVMLRDVLPHNVEYIPRSTRLWNGSYDGAFETTNNLVSEKGINIGSYAPGASAYVRFRVKVVDKNLAYGGNTIVNWGQGGVGKKTIQDYASVHLTKE